MITELLSRGARVRALPGAPAFSIHLVNRGMGHPSQSVTVLRRPSISAWQALIGHTSAKITERYAMVAPGKLIGAADILGPAQASAREHVENEKREPTIRRADRVAGSLGKRKTAG